MTVVPSFERKEVIVQFQEPINWFGMSPDDAIEFAYVLYEKAKVLKGDTSRLVLPGKLS